MIRGISPNISDVDFAFQSFAIDEISTSETLYGGISVINQFLPNNFWLCACSRKNPYYIITSATNKIYLI